MLGVTGKLPALSPLPYNLRPLRDLSVVARDEDLAWLRDGSGDRLLVGQPGIGKTFLLGQLVSDGGVWFAHDADADDLADAIREHRPGRIIVEDAHAREELLRLLLRHRVETEAEFAIVADCWPSHADDVKTTLPSRLSPVLAGPDSCGWRDLAGLPQSRRRNPSPTLQIRPPWAYTYGQRRNG